VAGIYKRSLFLFFVLILGLLFLSQTVLAEEKTEQKNLQNSEQQKDKQSSYNLEEIPVTDKRAGEPVASRYAVPESSKLQTEVFTREDIEAIKPETVLDVLQFVPGIEITYQGRKQLDFTNIRGQGSLGLVIDGVYISAGGFTQRALATFPVDSIESITVVRDATALTLGPLTNFGSGNGSSNQGFIIIKTKRAAKPEAGFVTSYGTFDTHKEHVYLGAKAPKVDFRVSFTNQESQGKENWHNAWSSDSLNLRTGYSSEAFNADMFLFKSSAMRELQLGMQDNGTLNKSQKWKYDPMESTLFGFNMSKPWNARQTTTFGYGFGRTDFDFVSSTYANPSKETTTSSKQLGSTFDLRHVAAFSNNTLRLGGQVLSRGTEQRTDSQQMYSLFTHDEQRFLNNRLIVDGGIRVDKKYYHNSPVTGNYLGEWSDPVYTLAAGIAYKLNHLLTATGRYAYSEDDLATYQIDPVTKGSLPPEKRHRIEGGLLANLHPAFNPSVTVFYYDTKNQKVASTGVDPNTGKIVSSYIDPNTGEEVDYVTTADAVRTYGIELAVSGNFLKSFSYNLNYSYMTTDDDVTNERQPHITASGRVGYRYKNWDANVNLRYYGPWSVNVSDGQSADYNYGNYYNWGANVSYYPSLFKRAMKITAYAQNLGDYEFVTRYRKGYGYFPDPGRRCGIELAYEFL